MLLNVPKWKQEMDHGGCTENSRDNSCSSRSLERAEAAVKGSNTGALLCVA